MEQKTVVVVGAGYGGVCAALELDRGLPADMRIVVMDRGARQEMYSLLYEAATAVVSGQTRREYGNLIDTIGVPYEEIFSGTRIELLRGEVKGIELKERYIALQTSAGESRRVGFDTVIVALGSETNYFGVAGLRERAYSLKSVAEAINMRNALEELFAVRGPDQRINVVIGGGGFSGIELAGELAGFVKILAAQHEIPVERVTLSVVEAGAEILPGVHPHTREAVRRRLESLGVHLYVQSPIASYDGFTVYVTGGLALPADMLIWTAGVRASTVVEGIAGVTLERKCLVVNEYLQIDGFMNAYGIGDAVYCFNTATNAPVPSTAQRALQHGACVAKNIIRQYAGRSLMPCRTRQPAFLAPVGGKFAVAEIGPLHWSGKTAWALKMLVTLKYLLSILSPRRALRVWVWGIWTYVRND